MKPQRNGCKEFDVPAAHRANGKHSGKYGKYDRSDADLPHHVGPESHVTGNPEHGRTQCNGQIQLVGNVTAFDIGDRSHDQRNCQAAPEQVDELFPVHGKQL